MTNYSLVNMFVNPGTHSNIKLLLHSILKCDVGIIPECAICPENPLQIPSVWVSKNISWYVRNKIHSLFRVTCFPRYLYSCIQALNSPHQTWRAMDPVGWPSWSLQDFRQIHPTATVCLHCTRTCYYWAFSLSKNVDHLW